MRMHIEVDDALMAAVDKVAGTRGRSAFVRDAIERALGEAQRRAMLRSVAGALTDAHEWDADPAAWVRDQRRADSRRTG